MTTTRFSIVYDGEPLSDGSIDVRDLAPCMLALADLLDETAPLVDPALLRVSLRVRPDFKKGSFEVLLDVASLYRDFVDLFSGPDAQAWASFFQIVGIAGVAGVFQLILRARGRKPTKVTIERKESVSVTFEGDAPILVDPRVWALFQNLRARKAVERVLMPLLDRGFDEFKIKDANGSETIRVTEKEAPYFRAPFEHENETVSQVETRVVIVAPSFNPGNKWRVTDGARSLYVTIRDEAFERAVQQGTAAFRKGDTLYVTLQTTQWTDGGRLVAEHSIAKVHRHEPGPIQKKLV